MSSHVTCSITNQQRGLTFTALLIVILKPMESKLKALKVVDLRDILTKAQVAIPAKANKQDLIAKIVQSQEAIDVYNELHGGGAAQTVAQPLETKPATPAPISAPSPAPVPPAQSSTPAAAPTPAASDPPASAAEASEAPAVSTDSMETPAPTESTDAAPVDPELEKRRARAARFGIPLVEPKAKKTPRSAAAATKPAAKPSEDPDKLAARKARFGSQLEPLPSTKPAKAPTSNNKRVASKTEEVDAAEAERRRKRAERFAQ